MRANLGGEKRIYIFDNANIGIFVCCSTVLDSV